MGEIKEFFPVVIGLVIGLACSRISAPRVRFGVMAALAVVIGALWSMTVGEFSESPAFALVDIGLVAIGAAIAYGLATLVWRRQAQAR